VAGNKRVLWLARGFLAATVIACLLHGGGAQAQSRIDTTITSPAIPPVASRRAPAIRPSIQPVPASNPRRLPPAATQPAAPAAASVPGVPSAVATAGNGAASSGVSGSGNANRATTAPRRLPLDGDLRPLIVPAPLDGTITLRPRVGLQDGGDPTREDGRASEDIAAFETPPAGYDPGAFSIELSPILDRRPAQLFRFQPYQPIGVRLGGFVLFSQIESGFEATSNVFESTTQRSDVAVDVAPRIRIVSNWRRHAVEFNAYGLASFHRDFSTEDERAYRLEARARLDITRHSNLEALLAREQTQEMRGSANSQNIAGQNLLDIVTDTAAATLNHRFNRLSLQLRGAVSRINYDPSAVNIAAPAASPVFVAVDDRDYNIRSIALRSSWEFNPQLTVFIETALNQRRYDRLQGGFDRDSDGQRWRTGVSFGNGGAFLRGEISVGYGVQDLRSPVLPTVEGFLIDANLAWRASSLTSILLNANTQIAETSIDHAGGGVTRTAGISIRHALRRNFITTAGLNYSTVDYQGANITENTLTAALGAEYSLNRNVVLFGNYDHVRFFSNQRAADYDADEVRLGVRLRK